MSKRFFYICAGVMLLALSYHVGARSAGAQAPGNPVASVAGYPPDFFVMTQSGDSYFTTDAGRTWTRNSNCFTGAGPVPAQQPTFGSVKARYR